jgi:hypothetical protein
MPALRHHPRTRGQRPRPVRSLAHDFLQHDLQSLLDSFIF